MLRFYKQNSSESQETSKIPPDSLNINMTELCKEILEDRERALKQYEDLYSEIIEQIADKYQEGLTEYIKSNKPALYKTIRATEEDLNSLWQQAQAGINNFSEFQHKTDYLQKLWEQACNSSDDRKTEQQDLWSISNLELMDEPEEEQDYILITTQTILEEECKKRLQAEAMGLDVETTGLDPLSERIRLIQIAVKDLPVMVIDVWSIQDIKPVIELLQGSNIKILHNAKFDIKMLTCAGIEVKGPLFDTMIAAQLISGGLKKEGENFKLSGVVKKYLNKELSKEQQKSNWSGELNRKQLNYAAKDATILLELREKLREQLCKCRLAEIARLEFDCIYSVCDMELNGIFLDKARQENIKQTLEKEVITAEEEARKFLGDINLNSSPQVITVLKRLGIDTDTADKKILKTFDHEACRKLIDYKEKLKFYKDNFIELPQIIHKKTGRIHCQYYQSGTETGRFTCQKPNLQQIPRRKEIRECFRAETGHKFIIADYSQIELRIGAELSKDETMINAYATGQDLHTITASFIIGKSPETITKQERQLAKAVNFGLIYGAGAETLKNYAKSDYGLDLTLEEATDFRNKFFQLYKGINNWHNTIKVKQPYITYTIGGRYRKFNQTKSFTPTDRLNSPDQGTGADILKKALVLLRPRIKDIAKLVHIVHDEIILEAPEARAEETAKILKETMEEAGRYYLKLVPVISEAGICNSWAEK